MKRFWHWLHSKRLSPVTWEETNVSVLWFLKRTCSHERSRSPVCVRACRCNSSLRVKRFPQKTQLQTNGRSPVCNRTWARSRDVFLNVFSQPGTWQMCFLFPTSPGLQGKHTDIYCKMWTNLHHIWGKETWFVFCLLIFHKLEPNSTE